MARMWAASLLSLKNPEGNRRLHAHLFALTGAGLEGTVTVDKSRRQACLTHPLERHESHLLRPEAFATSLRASLVEVVRYGAQGWAPQSGPGIGHDVNPHAGVISTVFPVA
jgi:hypothetical protein